MPACMGGLHRRHVHDNLQVRSRRRWRAPWVPARARAAPILLTPSLDAIGIAAHAAHVDRTPPASSVLRETCHASRLRPRRHVVWQQFSTVTAEPVLRVWVGHRGAAPNAVVDDHRVPTDRVRFWSVLARLFAPRVEIVLFGRRLLVRAAPRCVVVRRARDAVIRRSAVDGVEHLLRHARDWTSCALHVGDPRAIANARRASTRPISAHAYASGMRPFPAVFL